MTLHVSRHIFLRHNECNKSKRWWYQVTAGCVSITLYEACSHGSYAQPSCLLLYAGLGACALCMAGAAQLIQYSKRASGSYNYSPYTLTTLVEVAKLGISLVGLLVEFRSHGYIACTATLRCL